MEDQGRQILKPEHRDEHSRLRELVAKAQDLIARARENCCQLDQLGAARKDARARGIKRATQDGPYAKFGVDLAADSAEPKSRSKAPSALSGPEFLLLIAEDNQDDFELLQRACRKAALKAVLHRVTHGAQALEFLSKLEPRVTSICVVSDIKLFDMSGFELLQAIRAMPLHVPVGFVFLTGNTHPAIQCRALESGADGFFFKTCCPGQFIELIRTVESLLSASPVKKRWTAKRRLAGSIWASADVA